MKEIHETRHHRPLPEVSHNHDAIRESREGLAMVNDYYGTNDVEVHL